MKLVWTLKRTRQQGVEKVLGTEKPPVPACPGAPDDGVPASDTIALTGTWLPGSHPEMSQLHSGQCGPEAEPGIVRELPCRDSL